MTAWRAAHLAPVLALLAACAVAPPDGPAPETPERDAPQETSPAPQAGRSEESRALAAHYARLQDDLLARGLLRTDGGGPDTRYGARDLLRNFERIAFYEEYVRGGGLRRAADTPGRLKRWPGPVRVTAEFGASVPPAQRTRDENSLRAYTARLARVTEHPITYTEGGSANFHVLFMGEDDRARALRRIRALVPDIDANALGIIRDLPRAVHCLVFAFSEDPGGQRYDQAIAFIRAEHPDLMRRSCIHEEVAQGLGLANDSPRARPSIFNDDDEFALLTSHDEMLLRMLYDPRLEAGMTLDEARPVLRRILAERTGS
jgi:hypothetical protein